MSGIMSVNDMMANGLTVGLGTDVSGGYSPSILDSVRQAIIASKVKHMENERHKPMTHEQGFYLATMGGSKTLGLDQQIGTITVGKYFDALIIDPAVPGTLLVCSRF